MGFILRAQHHQVLSCPGLFLLQWGVRVPSALQDLTLRMGCVTCRDKSSLSHYPPLDYMQKYSGYLQRYSVNWGDPF